MGKLDITEWTWQFISVSDISGVCSINGALLKMSEKNKVFAGDVIYYEVVFL